MPPALDPKFVKRVWDTHPHSDVHEAYLGNVRPFYRRKINEFRDYVIAYMDKDGLLFYEFGGQFFEIRYSRHRDLQVEITKISQFLANEEISQVDAEILLDILMIELEKQVD